jgi:hypothetical protein
MVLHVTENASAARRLDVNVDASYPNAWREAPYLEQLKRISRDVPVRVHVGQKMTILSNGEEREDSCQVAQEVPAELVASTGSASTDATGPRHYYHPGHEVTGTTILREFRGPRRHL